MEQGFVIEAGEDGNPRRRIERDAVLLQRQHLANFAKRVEKEVTVAQFGPGHPVFCLSSLNCQSFSHLSYVVSGFSRTSPGPPEGGHYVLRLLWKRPGSQRRARRHEQLLLAVQHVGDRRRAVQRRAHLIPPQQLSIARVEREEIALR